MRKPRLLLAVVGAVLAVVAVAGPGGAHSGGKVQLFLKDLKVERVGSGYDIAAVLVDRDSGEAATGYSTTLEGRSVDGQAFPATQMTAEPSGTYRLSLPADPGTWTVTLRSVAVPGTDDAVPLVDQKQISFPVEGSAGISGDGGGGGSGAVMALIVAVGLAGVAGVAFARRRRPEAVL
jgi:hypothetical protein